MPLYTYECPEHGCFDVEFSLKDELPLTVECMWEDPAVFLIDDFCGQDAKRIYTAPQLTPMMHEHFNRGVGEVVSTKRGHRDALKRKSDEATERTGIEHNYVPAPLDEIRSSFDRDE